jgi:dATP pyrophosphohydrolase
VEVCPFRFVHDRVQYLLLRRSENESIHPGLWQIVTGTMEDGESALQAARRELREETSIVPVRFWVVPFINSFYDHRHDTINLIPFFAAQRAAGEDPRLSAEHGASAWVTYEEGRNRLVWPGQRNGLDIVHRYLVGGEKAARMTEVPV